MWSGLAWVVVVLFLYIIILIMRIDLDPVAAELLDALEICGWCAHATAMLHHVVSIEGLFFSSLLMDQGKKTPGAVWLHAAAVGQSLGGQVDVTILVF